MKFAKDGISKDELVKEFFLTKNIKESAKHHYLKFTQIKI
jgi:hypothetical protein